MLVTPEWPFYASFGIKLGEIKVADIKKYSFIRPLTRSDGKYLRGIKIQISVLSWGAFEAVFVRVSEKFCRRKIDQTLSKHRIHKRFFFSRQILIGRKQEIKIIVSFSLNKRFSQKNEYKKKLEYTQSMLFVYKEHLIQNFI